MSTTKTNGRDLATKIGTWVGVTIAAAICLAVAALLFTICVVAIVALFGLL